MSSDLTKFESADQNPATIEADNPKFSVTTLSDDRVLISYLEYDQALTKYGFGFVIMNIAEGVTDYTKYESILFDYNIGNEYQNDSLNGFEISNSEFGFIFTDIEGIKYSKANFSNETLSSPVIIAPEHGREVSVADLGSESFAVAWRHQASIKIAKANKLTGSLETDVISLPITSASRPDIVKIDDKFLGIVYRSYNDDNVSFGDIGFVVVDYENLEIADNFQVNDRTVAWQHFPVAVSDGDGTVYFSWHSDYKPDDSLFYDDVVIRNYSIQTNAFSDEIIVNDFRKDSQKYPDLAISNGNELLVSYASANSPNTGIYLKAFNQNLAPISPEIFAIEDNDVTTSALVVNNAGNILLVSSLLPDYWNDPNGPLKLWSKKLTDILNGSPSGNLDIFGNPVQNSVLEARISDLEDPDGVGELSYKWLADGQELVNNLNEKNFFVLREAHIGKSITAEISYVDGNGFPEALSSKTDSLIKRDDQPAIEFQVVSSNQSGAVIGVFPTTSSDDYRGFTGSGDEGISSYKFDLQYDPNQFSWSGISGQFYSNAVNAVSDGNYKISGQAQFYYMTDLDEPFFTFPVEFSQNNRQLDLSISNLQIDNIDHRDISTTFDLSLVKLKVYLEGREAGVSDSFGQDLSGVTISYKYSNQSGFDESVVRTFDELYPSSGTDVSIPHGAKSMLVTAEKQVEKESIDAITSYDALQALRLSVGLDKSDGYTHYHDFIAADLNKDGRVTSADALDILKYAVGIKIETPIDWVFIQDQNYKKDWSHLDKNNVSYQEGEVIDFLYADDRSSLKGILVGDVDGSFIA